MSTAAPPPGGVPHPPPEAPCPESGDGYAYPASTSGAATYDTGAYPAPAGPLPVAPPPVHSGAYPAGPPPLLSGGYPVAPPLPPSGAYPVPGQTGGPYPAYVSGAQPVRGTGSHGLMGGAQAEAGIRTVLERTYGAILPGVTRNDNAPLLNPVYGSTLRQVPVARLMGYSDVTTVVSDARRGALLGVIERAWLSFGYVMGEVDGDFAMPSMDVRTPDGFAVQLQVGAPGNVYFTVSSPMIERPGDPFAYSGPLEPTRLPDVDHPFWSH